MKRITRLSAITLLLFVTACERSPSRPERGSSQPLPLEPAATLPDTSAEPTKGASAAEPMKLEAVRLLGMSQSEAQRAYVGKTVQGRLVRHPGDRDVPVKWTPEHDQSMIVRFNFTWQRPGEPVEVVIKGVVKDVNVSNRTLSIECGQGDVAVGAVE